MTSLWEVETKNRNLDDFADGTLAAPESETAGSSTTLRSGRDDKKGRR